ncbi:hypothetical protein A7E78_10955 [Syntrophotalea acetylenivorans]|uniref:DUF393 domain-containing protein n=1 Tax=Syntrophotalea acetylenivorans TaxID=1842532 RepID=A0A1L3GQV6_9BACT|nr:DUF393 domain-containing protein [Syntrophotalea acetylenivorans]APG28322.1 hypothetical protein A7E78_10955 [Syntrophotalea acetylenivorans]
MGRSPKILFPLTVFYDGNCPVCSREIFHYRPLNRAGRLDFIDISAPSFDAAARGLDQAALMKAMHVQDAAGRLYLGVDAFRALWLGLPGLRYRCLSQLLGLPGVHLLAVLGYRVFARFRHLLPRRCRGMNNGVAILSPPSVKRREFIAIACGLGYRVEQVDGGLKAALQEPRSPLGDH